jgi:hypothetical protein
MCEESKGCRVVVASDLHNMLHIQLFIISPGNKIDNSIIYTRKYYIITRKQSQRHDDQ